MTENTKPNKPKHVELQFTVENKEEFTKDFLHLAILALTSNKHIYDNFVTFIDDHYNHREYVQYESLYVLHDWEEMIDGKNTRIHHPYLSVLCSSLKISKDTDVYDITVYISVNPYGDTEYQIDVPIDLITCADPGRIKRLIYPDWEVEELNEVDSKEHAETNPWIDDVIGLKLEEQDDKVVLQTILDVLMDLTDIGDYLDDAE